MYNAREREDSRSRAKVGIAAQFLGCAGADCASPIGAIIPVRAL